MCLNEKKNTGQHIGILTTGFRMFGKRWRVEENTLKSRLIVFLGESGRIGMVENMPMLLESFIVGDVGWRETSIPLLFLFLQEKKSERRNHTTVGAIYSRRRGVEDISFLVVLFFVGGEEGEGRHAFP